MTSSSNSQLGSQRGVFGYLPSHSDLVRVRASSREVRALESWLERGLHQSRWEMGSGFVPAYSFLTHRFVFRPDNSSQVLLGVLFASQDVHQRLFPFVAFESLSTREWDQSPLDIVRCNDPLFVELEELVQDVASLPQLGQVHNRVLYARQPLLTAPLPASEAGARNDTRYQNFLDEVTCGELGPPGLGVAICRDLFILLRGDGTAPRDPRSIRAPIELPLQRPPLARELELRFYIELCSLLLAPAQPTFTFFWKLGGSEAGSLFICLREPTIDVFCALLRRGAPARGVLSPGRDAVMDASAMGPLPVREDMTLATFLRSLQPFGPRVFDTAAASRSL